MILNLDIDDSFSNHRIQPITSDNQTDVEISPLSYNEVCSIINKLKSNKLGGTDTIISELIKQGGRTFKQRIYKLLLMMWEKEHLPNHWKEGIICPLYKKGDILDCTNYRPITLLNVAYKIFAIILNQKLLDIIETELGDYESGFRPSRSTIDNIFMIRQIIEKCYEYNIDIRNIFIDYTHAFDSIKGNKIIDSLTQIKVPPKLIRLVKLTFENTTAKVKVNNAYTSEFRVESGVKQGDPLSPTLFNLVIDTVLRKLDLKGNISTQLRQLMAYADNVLRTAHTKQSLIDTFQQLKNNSVEVRLTINEK